MNLTKQDILEAAAHFEGIGTPVSGEVFGNGHINDTFHVHDGEGGSLILQLINTDVFRMPKELMENAIRVSEHLKGKILARGGDPAKENLTFLYAKNGDPYYIDEPGRFWRATVLIDGTESYEVALSGEHFREAGVLVGQFVQMLDDFPVEVLHETIPQFHDTHNRIRQLKDAVERNDAGRIDDDGVRELVDLAMELSYVADFDKDPGIPKRVAHNDAKMSNVLFNSRTRKGVCLIDYDTIMPGYVMHDYGNAIRTGANTGAEDERDLANVRLDLDLMKVYTEGFLEGIGGILTDAEIAYLPEGSMQMTYEDGIRFLADYINGDTYYRIHYPDQNLVRARCQLHFVEVLAEHRDQMHDIIEQSLNQ